MKILIIEDQENLARLIKDGLESEGFLAEYVLDGEQAQTRIDFEHDQYDLILMDVMLPKKNGLELCRFCRKNNYNVPILMLTAKDSQEDIINGLNAGADDYLVKPFSFEILIARIHALLRRPSDTVPTILRAKDISLDLNKKIVLNNKNEVKLTVKEFCILEYLLRHPNQVINRQQLIANIWDGSADSYSNFIDVHINNLRRKLSSQKHDLIETINGLGYKINQ